MLNPFGRHNLLITILLGLVVLLPTAKANDTLPPVLVVSSYDPDAQLISSNINAFLDEFSDLGINNTVIIDNMRCRSFSEAHKWTNRLRRLLRRNRREHGEPAAIVLLGQEAWASYLSLPEGQRLKAPALGALTSNNFCFLPQDSTDYWIPDSHNFTEEILPNNTNCSSAFAYSYDVIGTTNMMLSLYPETQHVAFISDNTYGGVAMQSHVVETYAKHFPQLDLILLDGRQHTIYSMIDQLHTLPEKTSILIGTWRTDRNEGFFMKNATYAMMEAVPDIPAFTLSSLGFDYWAIGGVVPQYRNVGRLLAHKVARLIKSPQCAPQLNELIESKPTIDAKVAARMNTDLSPFKQDYVMLNLPPSFYNTYFYQIWAIVGIFVVVAAAFVFTYHLYRNVKRMKDNLEVSERELLRAKNNAEEANQLKSIFVANMSHEIRTPLNTIMGFSQLITDNEVETVEDMHRFVNVIMSNSMILLRLIDDILDVSRLETNHMKFYYREVDLHALGQEIIDTCNISTKNENKYIFAPAQKSLTIVTDPVRLQQVINNLLSNSDKFTKNGTITLSVESDGRMALFAVTDTGCGIPPEKQAKVFERFEKLNEYKQGTGLGLSICRLTIEKLGGHIWYDNGYTGGARFVFTHPLLRSGM